MLCSCLAPEMFCGRYVKLDFMKYNSAVHMGIASKGSAAEVGFCLAAVAFRDPHSLHGN